MPGPGEAPPLQLDKLCPSFERFCGETPPCVILGDLTTEYFAAKGASEPRSYHEGVIVALGAVVPEPSAPLEVTLYLNDLRLRHAKRGLAFWKPRTPPEVLDRPVTLRMPLAPGDAMAVVSDTEEPETAQLVLLTLSRAE